LCFFHSAAPCALIHPERTAEGRALTPRSAELRFPFSCSYFPPVGSRPPARWLPLPN
jgi:hypothetical protein